MAKNNRLNVSLLPLLVLFGFYGLYSYIVKPIDETKAVYISGVENKIKIGKLTSNRNLAFGCKNIFEEILQEKDFLIVGDPSSAELIFSAEILYLDVNRTKRNISVFHSDVEETLVVIKGTLTDKNGKKIKEAVATFKGVKRRFDYILKNEKCVLIDDYAHHPEELKALINGVKNIFKDKKVTVVFQPHLYSRTNDLAKQFAQSLDLADEVILLPIYPARELPMAGVESKMIVEKMESTKKHLFSKEAMQNWISVNQPELLVMAGAGDIDALVLSVAEIMKMYK